MTTHELLEDKHNFYVVSEILRGGSVMSRLQYMGQFPEDEVLRIIKQVAEALQYLHFNSIAHRDIKLENIMFVGEDGKIDDLQIKLIDFGFAEKFDRKKGMKLILGSPLYMAPELVNKSIYNEAIDVWALGIITYLLLCGLTPFQASTIQQIHENVLNKEVAFDSRKWEAVSENAKNFILTCLNKDHKVRRSINWLLINDRWLQTPSKQTIVKRKS